LSIHIVLRSPFADPVVRDIVDGRWAEPSGDPEVTLGEGLWALPGLVDAHAHLAAEELNYLPGVLSEAIDRARGSLDAGVTLVLDKGWTDDVTVRLIESLPAGERPEIEAAARIIANVDGYIPGFALEVGETSLAEAVRNQAAAGAGWVKLIGDWPRRGVGPVANFDESQLRDAVQAAGEVGAKVAIHTMAPEVPSIAVAAGVQSIEHGLFLDRGDIEALGKRRGMWVPTILRCEATLSQLGAESSGGKLFVEGLGRIRELLPLAVEAGVHVLAGTDLIGSPADVAAEALKLSEYGLSAGQAARAVSISAFQATGRGGFFEVGAPADAALFADNPAVSLGVLAHPAHVIRLGQVR
jgi:imidazolonepropionase-like amidohydrolase